MTMETIEIPRFLLDYFDSTTIRTPLSSIQGYADVMLKEIAGPLTDDQKRFLEIIRHNAEQLNKHFSLVIHNQHYIVWEQQAFPGQYSVGEIISDFEEVINHFPPMTVAIQVSDDSLPVWADKRHLHNAFSSIVEFASHIYDENKGGEIALKTSDKSGFITFEFEISKKENISKKDLSYYQSYLFVALRVIELHNGILTLQDELPEKLQISLVFPNIPKLSSK
jgi:K+-sensing histidine kinase KdpD